MVEYPVHTRSVTCSSQVAATRPVGQAVKTPPFHGGNMGSIPVRVTKKRDTPFGVCLFCCTGIERSKCGADEHRLRPAGRAQHISCRPFRDGNANDSRTGHHIKLRPLGASPPDTHCAGIFLRSGYFLAEIICKIPAVPWIRKNIYIMYLLYALKDIKFIKCLNSIQK